MTVRRRERRPGVTRREALLEYLWTRHSGRVPPLGQLSEDLGISRTNARYHVRILREQGLLDDNGVMTSSTAMAAADSS